MLQAGTVVGAYEIRGSIGAGGMGVVYLGWDPRLRREVAIKTLFAHGASDADRRRRIEQEARAVGTLNHPNVLSVYDVGWHDGAPYIVTERLEGETLRARIAAGNLTYRKAIEYAIQIARGLAAAHERGIVHRDLKPDNVFLCANGTAKILDFGIAKLLDPDGDEDVTISRVTEAGTVLGTAAYMSPEQVQARDVGPQSDLFSLGVVLFEMLAGKRPFEGATRAEVLTAILREEPASLQTLGDGIPVAIDRIVRRCLEKQPLDRFDTAKDVALALEAWSFDAAHPPTRNVQRGRLLPVLLILGGIMAGLAGGILVSDARRSPPSLPTYTQLTFRRGTIAGARFAPDGEAIVYSAAWDGEPARIFTTRIGGRESRDLETQGTLFGVSSKGDLAIRLGVARRAGIEGTLASVSLSGGSPHELLAHVRSAAWDAAGRDIAVLRADNDAAHIEYPIGTIIHRITGSTGGLCVLPDGRIAVSEYVSEERDGRYGISILDGKGARRVLTRGWVEPVQIAWSASTNEIFFAGTTGGPIDLHAVSLDGRHRVVTRVPGDFQLQDVDRRGRILLSRSFPRGAVLALPPGETQERDLSWLDFSFVTDISADGRRLLISDIGGSFGSRGAMALRNTDGTPVEVVGEGSPLDLSPDGQRILALPDQSGSGDRLIIVPAGAGARNELTHPSLASFVEGAWFPDSRRIAVVAGPSGATRLYVWSATASDAPRPLSEVGSFGKPVVSPDSKWITVSKVGSVLYRYFVDGATPQVIRGTSTSDEPLEISADRRWLFVRSGAELPARIERVELATGRRTLWKELHPAEPAGVFGISSIVVTPDGSSYAYTVASSVGALYLAEGIR